MDRQPSEPPRDTFAAYQEQLRRGHDALIAGDARDALEAYRAAAALADERALPHVAIGRVLLSLRRPSDAIVAFDRALERAARDPAALAGKAEALTRLNRHDEAAALRRQAALAGGELYDGTGDGAAGALPRAEALTVAAEKAWQEGQLQAAIDEWLAAARQHAADGHLYAALDVCQRALLAEPADVGVHLEMSRLYLAAGLTEQAVERMLRLARLLELEPMPELRAELAVLARQHAGVDARLAELGQQLAKPAAG